MNSNRTRKPSSTQKADWFALAFEMLFLSSLLTLAFSFHSSTSHSIVVKDFLAFFYAPLFLLLGGFLLVRERAWRRVPLSLIAPLLLYAVYGTVRCLQSPYPEHSWAQWSLTLAGMTSAIPAFLLFQRRNSVRRFVWVSAAVAAGLVGYAVLQFLSVLTGIETIDPINWPWSSAPLLGSFLQFAESGEGSMKWERFDGFGSLPGVCSTLGNPNFLAGYLAPFLGLFVAAALCAWRGARKKTAPDRPFLSFPWSLALAVVCIFGMFLTGSRGILLGFVGVGVPVAFFLGAELLSYGRKRGGAALLSLALIGMIGAPIAVIVFFWPSNAERAETVVGSVENRSIVYLCTSWLIRDHLWFGVTPGNFTIRFPEYLTGEEAERYGWMEAPEEKVLEHAHSEFLEIAADLGLVGLGLWGAALVAWLRWMWVGWKSLLDPSSRWLIAGLVAGVGGALYQDSISVALRWISNGWVYWTFIGAGAGWVCGRIGGRPPLRWGDSPKALLAIGCLAASLMFLPNAKRFAADWHFVMGRNLVSTLSPKSEAAFLRSIELNPGFPQSRYLLAGYYYATGRFEEAIREYEEVRRLRGEVVVLTENLATTYFKLSTTLESEAERQDALLSAIDLYEASLERHPTFPRLYDYLSRAYQRIGLERLAVEHRRRAIELYERWFTWEYRYGRARYALDLGKLYFLEKEYEKAFWQARNAKRWGERPESLESLKRVLFEADPSLSDRWEREDHKEAEDPAGESIPNGPVEVGPRR